MENNSAPDSLRLFVPGVLSGTEKTIRIVGCFFFHYYYYLLIHYSVCGDTSRIKQFNDGSLLSIPFAVLVEGWLFSLCVRFRSAGLAGVGAPSL